MKVFERNILSGEKVPLQGKRLCKETKSYISETTDLVYLILSTVTKRNPIIYMNNLDYHQDWLKNNIDHLSDYSNKAAIHLAASDCNFQVLQQLRLYQANVDLVGSAKSMTAKDIVYKRLAAERLLVKDLLLPSALRSRARTEVGACLSSLVTLSSDWATNNDEDLSH